MIGPICETVEQPSEKPRDTLCRVSKKQFFYQSMHVVCMIVECTVFASLLNNATRELKLQFCAWADFIYFVSRHFTYQEFLTLSLQNRISFTVVAELENPPLRLWLLAQHGGSCYATSQRRSSNTDIGSISYYAQNTASTCGSHALSGGCQ